MSIYLNVNQQTSGPFEENVIAGWLQAGQLSPEVLACRHGASQWLPLKEVLTGATTGQAVVDWARQNFPNRVEVNHKFGGLRNDFAKSLDAEGVTSCGGQKHRWQDLQYVGYREERTAGFNLVRSMVRAAMYSGSERVTVKLAFQTGGVIIPGFINNQKELLSVLETCPAPRRKF